MKSSESVSVLLRVIETAERSAEAFLLTQEGDDPTWEEWDFHAWRRWVLVGGELHDLPRLQLEELYPVFVASLCFIVHQTRPFGSVP